MNRNNQSILVDEPREVDVVAIEKELSLLWRGAGESGESGPLEIRACSLNLIVVTEDQAAAEAIGDLVGEVTVEHPGRIFLVAAERAHVRPSIESWISARCSLPVSGGKQVCCEQITLVGRGADAHKIPSIIISLLVPDVPVVLLWKATVERTDAILQALVHICDRALIDSSENLEPQTALSAWSVYMEEEKDHATFGDLAWTHLNEVRSLIAQTFQPLELRKHLEAIDNLTIRYSSTRTPKHSGISQAFLLSGWLAKKLGWTQIHHLRQISPGEYTGKCRLGDQAISVHIVPVPPHCGSLGGIESVSLRSTAGLDIVWQMSEDCGGIRTLASIGELKEERMVPVRDHTEAQLTSRELEMLERDMLYEESLSTFLKLLNKNSA